MSAPIPIDRRAVLKQRSRQAIVDAAAALLEEHSGLHFTVDQLAERADVSRRTVFNYFATLDDVVIAVCSDGVLGGLTDTFVSNAVAAPPTDDTPAAMFAEIAHSLRTTDLVGPMAYLTRILGGPDRDPEAPWMGALLLRAFGDVSQRFAGAMASRHPAANALDVHLLVNALVSGLIVLYHHWYAATGATDDDASRAVWDALLEHLLATVASGYGAAPAR